MEKGTRMFVLVAVAVAIIFSGCIEEFPVKPSEVITPTPTPTPTPTSMPILASTPTPTPKIEPPLKEIDVYVASINYIPVLDINIKGYKEAQIEVVVYDNNKRIIQEFVTLAPFDGKYRGYTSLKLGKSQESIETKDYTVLIRDLEGRKLYQETWRIPETRIGIIQVGPLCRARFDKLGKHFLIAIVETIENENYRDSMWVQARTEFYIDEKYVGEGISTRRTSFYIEDINKKLSRHGRWLNGGEVDVQFLPITLEENKIYNVKVVAKNEKGKIFDTREKRLVVADNLRAELQEPYYYNNIETDCIFRVYCD